MLVADRRVPFTELDEAIHVLDTPSEPWTIELEAGIAGRLDEERFRRAVQTALSAHPMARVRQVPARPTDRHYTWELTTGPDVDPVRVVDVDDERRLAALRAEFYSRPIPLSQSPPLRVGLARRAGGDVVMLSVNHAAFDGFGILRVLQSIANAYAGRPDPDAPVELDEARDLQRHFADASPVDRLRRLRAVADKLRDLAAPPARLATERAPGGPGYGFRHLAIPLPESGPVGTINDVLIAALNLAIAGWNEEHGVKCRRIGVLMPVNLRPGDWRTDVVTNFVVETRVSTTEAQRRTPAELLQAVVQQTERIKRSEGPALLDVLRHASRLPVWVKQKLSTFLAVTGNRLVDTAVLSNLGKVEPLWFDEDAGKVVELWFSAPARMPCGLSVGVLSLGDTLHLSFRYRRALWGDEAAAAFVDRFRIELGVVVRETS